MRNLWLACPKVMPKDFLGTQHSLLSEFCFFCPTGISVLYILCVYIHTSDCVQTVYELPFLPNNTTVKHFYINRSGAKCCLDIYHLGASLAVTGRIRDVGQNVFTILFTNMKWQQPISCNIFFLIAFLGEALNTNII